MIGIIELATVYGDIGLSARFEASSRSFAKISKLPVQTLWKGEGYGRVLNFRC